MANEIIISLPEHVTAIAACQKICFPKSFAVRLGNACTTKSLQWFFARSNRFLIHLQDHEKVIGFCGGFMPMYHGDGSKSGIFNYAFKEAVFGLLKHPWLLLHRELWHFGIGFLKSKWQVRKRNKQADKPAQSNDVKDYLQSVAITIVCVHPDYRGQKLADKLLDYSEAFALENKRTSVCLGVKQKNKTAINAYERNGYSIDKELGDSFVMKKSNLA